jgi:hypothetical protein
MTYTLSKLPDEPIIIYDQDVNRDDSQSIADSLDAIAKLLDEQTEKCFLIYQIPNIRIELDELMQAASKAGRSSNGVLHHPNLRENVYVVDNALVKMAIKGLESATFGRAKVILFGSLEEALSYCRDKSGAPGL